MPVDRVHCIGFSEGEPVYPGGDALSLLSEIAAAAEELLQRPTRLPCDGVLLSADDVKAIRWAVEELRVRGAR